MICSTSTRSSRYSRSLFPRSAVADAAALCSVLSPPPRSPQTLHSHFSSPASYPHSRRDLLLNSGPHETILARPSPSLGTSPPLFTPTQPPQKENQIELLTDLNSNLLTYIARNRFPTLPGQSGLSHVQSLSQLGPYTATEAAKAGLINGVGYRQDVLDSVLEPEKGGDEERKVQGLYHYARVMEKAVEKSVAEAIDIGVVYLLGTIGDPGEWVVLLLLFPLLLSRRC